jgi:hypothetical protein
LFFTFLMTLTMGAAVGFGDSTKTTIIMSIFMFFILVGCVLFFRVKINLKRRNL